MQLYFVRIASLVVIALAYMLFDVFQKRNVPAVFAYGSLVYATMLTILYFDINTMIISGAIALVVLGLGYLVYKIGQLGLADVIEFAALSLIMPIQGATLLATNSVQFGLPFILSLLINTGIAAIIIVPIYYLPKAKAKLKKPLSSFITKREAFIAFILGVAYVAFIAFAIIVARVGLAGIILLLVMLASSCIIMLFSVPITYSMVEYVPVGKFDEGDIMAFNLMDSKTLGRLRKRIKGFDRLLTKELINRMRREKIKEKLPVYKEALPFALPIFIAVIASIVIGNLLFLILML